MSSRFVAVLLLAGPCLAQIPENERSFDVVTIKPSQPGLQGNGFSVNGRDFSTINTSLSDLITYAWGIQARQIGGGPDWLESDKFDLLAKPDVNGQASAAQLKKMVQQLLADRFKLAFHRDRKELSVYAIVVGEGGPKLTRSEGDSNGLPSLFFRSPGVLPAWNATIAEFAGLMQTVVLDRPVVDRTGISGRYDFTLTWTPNESQFGGRGGKITPPSGSANAPDLFTAIQEQMGLKLESTSALVDVFVIDRAEKPPGN